MTCVEKVTRTFRVGAVGVHIKSACDLIDGWGARSPASWRAALNWVSNHIRRGLGLARRVYEAPTGQIFYHHVVALYNRLCPPSGLGASYDAPHPRAAPKILEELVRL